MSGRNFMNFNAKLQKFAKDTDKEMGTKLRKTVLAGYQGAISTTNVQTGRARMSWRVAIGAVDTSVAREPESAPKKGTHATGTERQQSGMDKVAMQIKAGEMGNVFISNNVFYIDYLNKRYDYMNNIVSVMQKVAQE